MFLYNLTLQGATAVSATAVGHYSGTKTQEVAVARQQRLELWRVDPSTGRLAIAHSEKMFARVRSIASLRLPGAGRDLIAVGSDGGALAVYGWEKDGWAPAAYHEFGRTGLRRNVAGQYVASDPRGRAVLVAATERAKIVYVVTRDAEARVQLASPLDAGRTAAGVCVDAVGVDVGFDNPIFAALEVGGDGTMLVYYELDLGLNHVVRRWSAAAGSGAHRLIALPGGNDGPSGVLVCGDGCVTWQHSTGTAVTAEIPQRSMADGGDGRTSLIVASAVHRMRGAFFILVLSEAGDLFKISVEWSAEDGVQRLGVAYFDTIGPAASIAILRAGFLVAAALDAGNHRVYQFTDLGESAEEGAFHPRAELQSLALVDEADAAAPLLASSVLRLTDEPAPQIYTLGGRGSLATLRIVRHGAEAGELAEAALPGTPQSVHAAGSLIAVSFADATLALSVGEEVAEVPDSGLATDEPTLALAELDGNGLAQITPRAVRHVHSDGRVSEWAAPATVSCAAANSRQCLVASNARVLCFELREPLDELRECTRELDAHATCLALASVPPGRLRAPFAAVGCTDSTVRLFALDDGPDAEEEEEEGEPRAAIATLACTAEPHSVALVDLGGSLTLLVGLVNGALLRVAVDRASGALATPRTRVLGARPVLIRSMPSRNAALALSSAPYVCHAVRGRVLVTPLAYDALDDAATAPTAGGGGGSDGLVAVAGDSLRILALDRLEAAPGDAAFNSAAIPLQQTPRAFALHPESRHFAIIECDRLPASESYTSLVRVVSPFTGESTHIKELPAGHAAVSLALVTLGGEYLLAVGVANGLTLKPRACTDASVHVYRWTTNGTCLELLHATQVDDIPQCLAEFGGQLLVSLGGALRLYALGRRQLLRKAHTAVAPNAIVAVRVLGERLFVADVNASVRLVVFASSTFRVLVDDALPRFVSTIHVLDPDTVVGGDKFGNLFVLRLPERVSSLLDADPSGARIIHARPRLLGAAYKWDVLAEFHIGDIPTSIDTCSLAPAARPAIFYTTLLGSFQVAIPFVSRSDQTFFCALERAIRDLAPPMSGRDHRTFRSSYIPVRAVIDGDLCETYFGLDNDARQAIANQLDRDDDDILKKLEDIRAMSAF
ncbi:pre-mRNA-splicing factor rse1 [Coemansia sp. RSA 552]|nr:pre-mRNA-splicing factor rse1 [Coemansia sp. RSA 552]